MSDPESSLSDRILDISPSSFDKWYGFGHRDARQTAARLAKDSDVRIATLEAEAKRLHRWVEGESQGAGLSPNTVDAASEIANERGKQVERLVAEVERLTEERDNARAYGAEVKPSRADLLRAIHPGLTEYDMRIASTLIGEEAARLPPDCSPRRHHEARAERFRPLEDA